MAEIDGDFEEFPADAIWLQIPGETHRAYAAFCVYRNAGPLRSLRETCKVFYNLDELPPAHQNHNQLRQIKLWSSIHEWQNRALAYTSHLDKLSRIEHGERVRSMHKRQAANASTVAGKAMEKLRTVDASRLTVNEALKMFVEATRIERMARGQSSEIIETVDPVVAADQSLRHIIEHNPAAALAMRDLSLALTNEELAAQNMADGIGADEADDDEEVDDGEPDDDSPA